jgi:hypothetical protein
MIKKYKHGIDTMDGPIEWEDDIPPSPRRTPEEMEKERARLYPTEDIAFYLQYPCEYCQDKFFLVHPIRGKNMNPLRGGYMLESENDRRIIPICHTCVLDFSRRDENFRLK